AWLVDFRVDGRVLLFSLAVTMATGVLFGLAPAARAAGSAGPMTALKRREQRAGSGAGRRGPRGGLGGAEVAVAATVLAGGGLMVQSFRRLQAVELGFRPEGRLMMELPLSPAKYPETRQQADLADRVLERVRALPGVVSAGV